MQIDLVDVFVKQIRSVVEFGVPVWHSSITKMERNEIERVQKSFCKILLGDKYVSYSQSLSILKLETLETRQKNLSLRFALKAEKHDKFRNWFKPNIQTKVTRQKATKYLPVSSNHARFEKSPISYLTELLNDHYL